MHLLDEAGGVLSFCPPVLEFSSGCYMVYNYALALFLGRTRST